MIGIRVSGHTVFFPLKTEHQHSLRRESLLKIIPLPATERPSAFLASPLPFFFPLGFWIPMRIIVWVANRQRSLHSPNRSASQLGHPKSPRRCLCQAAWSTALFLLPSSHRPRHSVWPKRPSLNYRIERRARCWGCACRANRARPPMMVLSWECWIRHRVGG